MARKTIVERYSISRFIDDWNDLFYDTIENYSDVKVGDKIEVFDKKEIKRKLS